MPELIFDKLIIQTSGAYYIHFDMKDENSKIWLPKSRTTLVAAPTKDLNGPLLGVIDVAPWLVEEHDLDEYTRW